MKYLMSSCSSRTALSVSSAVQSQSTSTCTLCPHWNMLILSRTGVGEKGQPVWTHLPRETDSFTLLKVMQMEDTSCDWEIQCDTGVTCNQSLAWVTPHNEETLLTIYHTLWGVNLLISFITFVQHISICYILFSHGRMFWILKVTVH